MTSTEHTTVKQLPLGTVTQAGSSGVGGLLI